MLWYVDILGYLVKRCLLRVEGRKAGEGERMFPIGVCGYLLWHETHPSTYFTCTHHLWTIPLLLHGIEGRLDFGGYLMNVVTVAAFSIASRLFTPFGLGPAIAGDDDKEKTKRRRDRRFEKYLNVNLSHELWQDIKIGFLRQSVDHQQMPMYLLKLNLWWQMFNFVCFWMLKGLCGLFV
ncbi:hypothetical protein ACHAWF_000321 [Thalassiosira exigua]